MRSKHSDNNTLDLAIAESTIKEIINIQSSQKLEMFRIITNRGRWISILKTTPSVGTPPRTNAPTESAIQFSFTFKSRIDTVSQKGSVALLNTTADF